MFIKETITTVFAAMSLMASAQSLVWNKTLDGPKEEGFHSVTSNASGEFFCLMNATTFGGTVTYDGKEMTTPDNASTSGNKSLFLSKQNADGTTLWVVNTVGGDGSGLSSGSVIPTEDGGALLFFAWRHTLDATTETPFFELKDAKNGSHVINSDITDKKYESVMLKLSSEGTVEWSKLCASDHENGGNFEVNGSATDEAGNVYVCGSLKCDITIGETKIEFKNASEAKAEALLLKLNNKGEYVYHVQSEGTPSAIGAKGLKYLNGNIYLSGHAKSADNSEVTFGGKSFVAPAIQSAFVAKVDAATGEIKWLRLYEQEAGEAAKSQVNMPSSMDVNGENIFVCGRMVGAIKINSEKSVSSGTCTMQSRYILKLNESNGDIVDGECAGEMNATGKAFGVSNYEYVKIFGDKVLAVGYTMAVNAFYTTYDINDFSTFEKKDLATASTCTLQAATLSKDNILVIMLRGKSVFKSGEETLLTVTDGAFGGVVAAYQLEAPTAIENISAERKSDGKIYDLNGRVVTNPTRGLYIVNGKLYRVK